MNACGPNLTPADSFADPKSSLAELVFRARARLVAAGIPTEIAALDAEVLARHVLGWDRATYLTRRDRPIDQPQAEGFFDLVDRRAKHEPIQYLTGEQEFWGLRFVVSPAVLIPRPETELLVEEALKQLAGLDHPLVLDAGTGSGCVAIAIGHRHPTARLLASDSSSAALEIAAMNAARHQVEVRFRLGPFVPDDLPKLDMIVSNPPYVAEAVAESLSPEVRDHEPARALFGGRDGLDRLREVIAASPRALKPGGWLLLEFGVDQEQPVCQMAVSHGFAVRAVRTDLQGLPRVAVLRQGHH